MKELDIRYHETPKPHDAVYESKKGDAEQIYPQNTRVTVLSKGNKENPGWLYIRTDDGKEFWIEERNIHIPQNGALYPIKKVQEGDTPSTIVQREIKIPRGSG